MKLINQVDRTLNYPQVLGRFFIVFLFLAVLFTAFLLLSNKALANDGSKELVYFRIDTELDVLNSKGVVVSWTCGGSTASGSITDGTASESSLGDGVVQDGIVEVASSSKEMTDAGCIFNTSDTITAKVVLNGWVTRRWTASLPASSSAAFKTLASRDYLLVVSGAQDELGNSFNMASTSNATNTFASASYAQTTGDVASSSYHSNSWYVAPTGDGTLYGGKNGYVNKSSAVTWSSDYQTTSKSADFGTSTDSTYNGSALPFAVAATLNGTHSNGTTENNITGATVTAGDSNGTSCTGSSGIYYCAVPLAHTGVIATVTALHGFTKTLSCTYTDRDDGNDAQSTCTISATEAVSAGSGDSGGGGGGGGTTTTTPTPTPTPETSVSPSPTPSMMATPIPSVSPSAVSVTYELYRKVNDPKVYVKGSDGTLSWVRTLADFNTAGYKWSNVKLISGSEFAKMRVGGRIKVVKNVSFLRVRSGPSTKNTVMGTVKPGQVLQFYEWNNGWYKIQNADGKFGWVFGGYASEI